MLSPLIGRAPAAERAALVVCICLLAGSAWVALWLSGDSSFFHLHHLQMDTVASPSFVVFFVASWMVMTVAMMLPTSIPVLATLHNFAAGRANRVLLLSVAAAGYLLVWGLVGGAVYVGYRLVSELRTVWRMPAGGPLLLLFAGVFQFSSLKYKCLEKCRSPFSFVVEYWQGRNEFREAFRLGLDHGVFCVGCCWALMLLMFAVGAGSLAWMFVLAMVMAVEKNVSWGKRLRAPAGAALIAWGTALLWLG